MAKRTRHWVKLWVDWIDTKAHAELSEGAFGLGPLLLLLAVWDGTYEGGGWLLNEAGKPMSLEALARLTHRTVQRLKLQLDELEWCQTLKRRDDGALGFPNFGKWQETKSAKYMRTKRSLLPNSEPDSGPQTTDDRRCSPSENTPVVPTGDRTSTASTSDAKPKRGKPRAEFPEGLDLHLLAELNAAIGRVHGARSCKRKITAGDRDDLRKLYASEEPTPEDVTHVVGVREGMDRRREGYGELSWSHLCVPKNFRRYLERKPDPGPEGGPPSAHLSIDEIRRMEAEETDAAR